MFPLRISLLLLIALGSPARGSVRIAEFQAANRETLDDEDGDSSDWVELVNTGNVAYDLTGCKLSRNAAGTLAWSFPAVTLPPRALLLVWCSGKNRLDTAKPLHTSFTLPEGGGGLWLLSPSLAVLDNTFAAYGPQTTDRSLGIPFPGSTTTPLSQGSSGRFRGAARQLGWETPAFVDTASPWVTVQTGVGYDTTSSPVNFLPLLGSGGGVQSTIFNVRSCGYLRQDFQLPFPQQVRNVTLKMRFDDGFAAWLNGQRLVLPEEETNCPATLDHLSVATTARVDADALIAKTFPLGPMAGKLTTGRNLLAVQILNSAINSNDMLCIPELMVEAADFAAPGTPNFFVKPTPMQANGTETVLGFVDAPDFSLKRGFVYANQSVGLSTNTPGAAIYYTTNGDAPSETSGTLYTSPITITESTVLRAIAVKPGWSPSTEKAHSYLFPSNVLAQGATVDGFPATWGRQYDSTTGGLHPTNLVTADYAMDSAIVNHTIYGPEMLPALTNTLPVISISLDTVKLFGASGIYADGRLTSSLEHAASVEYFDPKSGDRFQEIAGLRAHGGHSLVAHAKKPFRLYFRKEYGLGKLDFPLFPGSAVRKFDTLQLRPGGHDGWAAPFGSDDTDLPPHATYLRDRFLRQTQQAMGQTAAEGRYVHLYLNGLYWGVYDLHEVPNKDYWADHSGGEKADWDVIEHSNTTTPSYSLVDGQSTAFDALMALVETPSNLVQTLPYTQVQQYLDLDSFIDNTLLHQWAAHQDWTGPIFRQGGNASRFYNKNWLTARESRGLTPGKFFWHLWDGEISMGTHLVGGLNLMRVDDFDLSKIGTPASITGFTGTPGPPGKIYYALRYNAAFRLRYADRVQKHFFNAGALSIPECQARLAKFTTELRLPLSAESARWGDVNSGNAAVVTFTPETHWRSEVNWMRDVYIPTRHALLLTQLSNEALWPSLLAPTFSQHGGLVPVNYELTLAAEPGAVIYYTLDGTDPINTMAADGTATPAASALIYNAPRFLTASVVVKARATTGSTAWSPLQEASFLVGTAANANNLKITEICYRPSITALELNAGYEGKDFEFIELQNTSAGPVDLGGCRFDDGIRFEFSTLQNRILQPGQRIVIAANANALQTRFPNIFISGSWGTASSLANTGERLELLAFNGTIIADVTFDDQFPWPASGTEGYSIVLREHASNLEAQSGLNWRLSSALGGNPTSSDALTFEAWQSEQNLTGNALSDPDGNGVAQLLEYALGIAPGAPEARRALQLSVEQALDSNDNEQDFALLRLPRRLVADDAILEVQNSSNLQQWDTTNVQIEESALPNAQGQLNQVWRAAQPVPQQARQYFRLRARLRTP
jgi:hypothetical protein